MFEVNNSIKNDRNRIRKRQRFCVVQCEDLKVLYYKEHEMRGIRRPQLRVVPKGRPMGHTGERTQRAVSC